MSEMVIFGGHVSGEGTNAQHVLRINVTYDFNSIRYLSTCKHKVLFNRLLFLELLQARADRVDLQTAS